MNWDPAAGLQRSDEVGRRGRCRGASQIFRHLAGDPDGRGRIDEIGRADLDGPGPDDAGIRGRRAPVMIPPMPMTGILTAEATW